MLEDIRNERIKKKEKLEKANLLPYPAKVKRTAPIAEILDNWKSSLKEKELSVVGRVFAIRGQGKLMFIDTKDESGKIQVVFKEDSGQGFELIKDTLDIGDFIEATGKAFVTQKGESSIEAKGVRIVTKALRPIPSEWYGVSDIETRLRQRYLDLLVNPDVKELFKKKAIFWKTTREFLVENGFLEVETPVLEPIPGGADARPFTTHHNAQNIDLYLRISLELYQKRLLVGGYERVFEIGRVFRNEGIDAEHLQDYTQMEFYSAYSDYNDAMVLVEDMYKKIVKATTGSLETTYKGNTIKWDGDWNKLDYCEAFEKETGLKISTCTKEDLEKKAKELKIKFEPNLNKGRLIDLVYKKTVRPFIIQPTFLINHPVEISPLAKRHDDDPSKTQRFQVLLGGSEVGNGWSELNDPIDQKKRFEEQARFREAGDDEAQMMDEDFVKALEYGMPPAAGFGFSERLFAFLMDKPIRETVFFPTLKPKK